MVWGGRPNASWRCDCVKGAASSPLLPDPKRARATNAPLPPHSPHHKTGRTVGPGCRRSQSPATLVLSPCGISGTCGGSSAAWEVGFGYWRGKSVKCHVLGSTFTERHPQTAARPEARSPCPPSNPTFARNTAIGLHCAGCL